MGISYDFGPPAETLDPRRPGGLDPWQGTRRLSKGQLKELVRVVEAEGWLVAEGSDGCHVEARLSDEHAFEELFFNANGGWLSKPSRDPDEAEEQLELVQTICDYAGWVVFDPQGGCLLYGVEVTCGVCGERIEYAKDECPQGHPVAKATFSITVTEPEDIPDDAVPAAPCTTEPRFFTHPDGRGWGVHVGGSTVQLVIVLADGERIERVRRHLDHAAALVDMDERIAKQLAGGFVEQTSR